MNNNELRDERDGTLFALPADHIVVALRNRTGHTHLGWRKPGPAERLRCAALLASDRFQRVRQADGTDRHHSTAVGATDDELTGEELSVLSPPAMTAGAARLHGLLDQLHRDPDGLGGTDILSDVQALEQLSAWIAATQAARLSRLAEPGCAGDPSDLAHAAARIDPDLTDAQPDPAHWTLAGIQLAVGHLGATLCISPVSAGFRISEAQDLMDNLPTLREVLQAGTIDPIRARILQQRTKVLEDADDRRKVVTSLLRVARRHNPGRFSKLVDAAVIEVDPDAAEARRQDALDRRGLRVDPYDDGMARFIATLPAPEAQLAWDLFDSIAQALKGFDDRCAAHRRADAFTTMIELIAAGHTVSAESLLQQVLAAECSCRSHHSSPTTEPPVAEGDSESAPTVGADIPATRSADDHTVVADNESADRASDAPGLDATDNRDAARSPSETTAVAGKKQWSLPTRQGRRTHATVVLPWEIFAGLPGAVAELAEYGMITAAWAKTLLEAAATVTLLVTDPTTGQPVAVGVRTYRPKQDVRDQVVTAYPTCIFTGCSRPSRCCDLDHLVPFHHAHPDRGGATNSANLFPVCRLHHRLKTSGGWSYEPTPEGVRVISPLGLTTTTTSAQVSSPLAPPGGTPPPF